MDNKGLIAGIVGMLLIIIGGLGFLAHETATGPSPLGLHGRVPGGRVAVSPDRVRRRVLVRCT